MNQAKQSRRQKLLGIAVVCGTYLALIALVNTIHFQFFTVRVVLYSAIYDVLIAGVLAVAFYYRVLRQQLELTEFEGLLSLACGLLLGINYAISIPAIIDRSLSIYILEKIDQRGGGIRFDSFERVFKEEYVPEHRLVDIRLTEQINSGTIAIKNGCVVLTSRGRTVVALTRFYRTTFLPKRREIMGEYTDALTDPFRNSRKDVSYQCKADD